MDAAKVRPQIEMPPALLGSDALPPPTIDAKPGTAVVKSDAPQLPAVVERVRGVSLGDLTMPVTAGSGWLAAIVAASALGATTPALVALGAGALASAIALGKGLVDRARETVVVAARTTKTPEAKPKRTYLSEAGATALRMALDTGNGDTIRVGRAEVFAKEAGRVSGVDCDALLRTLPRGVLWGYYGATSMPYLSVLPSLGLSRWGASNFEPCDVSAVVLCLSKLGPVTDAQRASILENAMEIVTSSIERGNRKASFNNEIDAAVRELVARAPKAVDEVVS